MTEIKVILEAAGQAFEAANKEERGLIFEQLLTQHPFVGRAAIDDHADLATEMINEKIRDDRPTLKELLLRKVILLSRNLCDRTGHNRIVPMIVDVGSVGGVGADNAIRVRFDIPVFGVKPFGEYMVPPGEEIIVVGLMVNGYCGPVMVVASDATTEVPAQEPFEYCKKDIRAIPTVRYCEDNPPSLVDWGAQGNNIRFMFAGNSEEIINATLISLFDYYVAHPIVEYNAKLISNEAAAIPIAPAFEAQTTTPPELSPAATFLASNVGGNFVSLGDVYNRGFGRIYDQLEAGASTSDPNVVALLEEYEAARKHAEFMAKNKVAMDNARSLADSYRAIIVKKFGEKKLAGLKGINILDGLSEAERKAVIAEHKKNEEHWQAVANNKCPHVAILKRLRRETDLSAIRAQLGALRKFFAKTGGRSVETSHETHTMITCNNCHYDLICPHVVARYECELANCNWAEMKNKMATFIARGAVRDQQFCQTCGEIIIGTFDDDSAPPISMDEDLKNFIWGEIVGLLKYLKFGALIDVPKLIAHCRDAIYVFIYDIEKQILKSKTNSADEIKAKKRMYVTMYALAYFVNLIISGKNIAEITFKEFEQKSKNIIADLLMKAIDIVMVTRNIAIRSTSMSPDVVKSTMVDIFKTIHAAGQQVIVHSGAAENITDTLLLDPVYKYIRNMNDIDAISGGRKPLKEFACLGADVNRISGDVYDAAIMPKFGGFRSEFAKYSAKSFENFMHRVKSRDYMKPIYVSGEGVDGSGISEESGSGISRYTPEFQKEMEKFAPVAKMDDEEVRMRKIRHIHNYTRIHVTDTRRWKVGEVSLGRIYDENGAAHKFDIYVITKSSKDKDTKSNPTHELKTADFAKLAEAGDGSTVTVVDRKCSVCGIRKSEVDNLDQSRIINKLSEQNEIDGFFQFYNQRCPKGGLHEWSEDGVTSKCTKCGYGDWNNGAKSAYYAKFRADYRKDRRETLDVIIQPTPPAELAPVDFLFNFNIVLDLANKVKMSQHLIMAIGATEKVEYNNILSGEYLPRETDEKYATRIYVIDSYIKSFITEYNQLRHIHKIARPNAELAAIVSDSGISRHKIADLNSLLPDIYGDYDNKFAWIQINRKPRDIVQFCIQSLCEMALAVWNDENKETEKLRRDFVRYKIKKILRAEELLSKPGYFSWSLLFGDKDSAPTDSNTTDTRPPAEDSDDEPMPMSNQFDVEEDSDEDPADVHVGDDYGL